MGAVSWQDVTYTDNQSDIFNLIFHIINVQKDTISATGDYSQVCFCQQKQLRVHLLKLYLSALLQIGTVSPRDTANLRKKTQQKKTLYRNIQKNYVAVYFPVPMFSDSIEHWSDVLCFGGKVKCS